MSAVKDAMKRAISLAEIRLQSLQKKYDDNKNAHADSTIANQIKQETEQLEGMEKLLKTMGGPCDS